MEVLHPRCAGLDVHKETVVACVRIVSGGEVTRAVRTFETTTARLIELAEWLEANGCTHVAWRRPGFTGSRSGRCWQQAASNWCWRTPRM